MRRAVRSIGWTGLVGSVSLLVALGAVLAAHPRDEEGYLGYVATYGDYDGKPIANMPPPATLLAAGDRACAWLEHQSFALWRTDPAHRVDTLYRRYRRSDAETDTLPQSVLPGAWAFLCPGSRYLHEPHAVFGRPED